MRFCPEWVFSMIAALIAQRYLQTNLSLRAYSIKNPEILNGGYDDTFDLTLAAKDLRLAMELANDVDAKLTFTADVTDFYSRAEAEFGPTAPHLMAMRAIENLNGLVLHEVQQSQSEGANPR